MEIIDRIKLINSFALDKRVQYASELISITNQILKEDPNNIELAENILSCMSGLRTSRFIESDVDIQLLDVSNSLIRTFKLGNQYLSKILKDQLYYSNYYPEKYNKQEIEIEIAAITNQK